MIIIFCSKMVYLPLSYYVKNINNYFVDMQVDSKIVLYTTPEYVKTYVVDNNIKKSFLIYIQKACDSPSTHCNKEFLINIEQMMNFDYKKWFSPDEVINSSMNIVDYSVANIDIAKKNNPDLDIFHIPYLFHKQGMHNENLYDVCIIGSYSEYRNKVHQELSLVGLRVIYVYNAYGEYCENILNESKIILNVHYIKESNILETIRCYQALYNRKIVISEDSIYDKNNDLDNLIIYSPYDKLLHTVMTVLRDYDHYKKKIDDFCFDKIKHEHKTLMMNFLDKYKYYDYISS